MNTSSTLRCYHLEPDSGQSPKSMVILLHGLGSDGRDMMGLARALCEDLPETVFVCPNAPERCDLSPLGFQWFSMRIWTPESLQAGAKGVLPLLQDFITHQLAHYTIPPERLVLGGFSQGAMMALHAGLSYPRPIGGVLAYSGGLADSDMANKTSAHKIPICLIHGQEDEVVSFDIYTQSHAALSQAGLEVQGHAIPNLGHSIDAIGIEAGVHFLSTCLPEQNHPSMSA